MKQLLRFVVVEVRDWVFAVLAIVAVFAIPAWTGGDWLLTGIVLAGFLVLYVAALRASRRWTGEGDAADPEATG